MPNLPNFTQPWERLSEQSAREVFFIRQAMINSFRQYFFENRYDELVSPKIVAGGLETNIAAFMFDFYGQQASLSKGPQMYKTLLLASGWEKVFEIGPVFRKEEKFTPGHVAEFTAVDADFTGIQSVDQVMDEFERIVTYVLNGLSGLDPKLQKVQMGIKTPIPVVPRLSMGEARDILSGSYGKILQPGDTLDKEAEKLVGKWALDTHGSELVMVHDFPWKDRFFYYMRRPDDPQGFGTYSFDMLYRGIEIATCARKEHRKEVIYAQAIDFGLDLGKLGPYTGCFDRLPPHGGGGIGVDRFLQTLTYLPDIRLAQQFPRDGSQLNP